MRQASTERRRPRFGSPLVTPNHTTRPAARGHLLNPRKFTSQFADLRRACCVSAPARTRRHRPLGVGRRALTAAYTITGAGSVQTIQSYWLRQLPLSNTPSSAESHTQAALRALGMHPETTLRAGERYSRAHTVDPGPLQADAQIIERGVDPAKIRMNRSEGHTRARSRSQHESSQKPATLPRQRESALRDRRGE